MLMPTKDRQQIYEYIFEEGVMVAKKGEPLCFSNWIVSFWQLVPVCSTLKPGHAI